MVFSIFFKRNGFVNITYTFSIKSMFFWKIIIVIIFFLNINKIKSTKDPFSFFLATFFLILDFSAIILIRINYSANPTEK